MEVPAHPKTSGVINSNLNTESDHMEIPALSRTGAITLCGLANEAKYVPLTTYNHTFKLFEIRSFSILGEKSGNFWSPGLFSDYNFTLFSEIYFKLEIVDFFLNW